MPRHTIVYSSDLHGNEVQYKKLVDYAIKTSANSIIIGGDIAPKNIPSEEFIRKQREFLLEKLPELLLSFKKQAPTNRIFLMLGNDDCAANQDAVERSDVFISIHGRRISLTEDFDIVGYSFVPITPFGIKDWEKYDFSDVPPEYSERYELRKKSNCRLDGKKSTSQGWTPFVFTPEMEKQDSIQRDLAQPPFTERAAKTLYVIHTPPDGTYLDLLHSREHVGSFAVRDFIEREQPYLTLHGHIHETVEVSGEFQDIIGRTICFSSGNHNVGSQLALVVFDLYRPEKAERLII